MNIVVFVTAKDADQAQRISSALIEARLAACVNIVTGICSLFWWEGKIDTADEALLIIKSTRSAFKKIVAAVKKTHSYDVPEVIALPIIDGNKDYLRWINDSVR